MNIIKDFIAPGMRHRPMTNPASSLYKKTMRAKYITVHEAWSNATAKTLHAYVKSQRAADRPASWHFSIDEKDCYQALPLTESGWHAGDNLGPGNTTTIGIEICDYGMRRDNNWSLFWQAVNHCAELCAYLIKTVDSLEPYPKCLKQHNDWSGKNCPALIRNGKHWQTFVDMVGEYLEVGEITKPVGSGDIWLTAGSYKAIENALSVSNDLSLIGQNTEIRQVEVSGANYYRVVVGYFNTRTEAVKLQNELNVKGFNTTIIDTNPQEEPEEKPEDPGSELPAGLMDLLRQLYELLKKLFGG